MLCWTDYKTNTEMLNELKITWVLEKINLYRSNWKNQVNRMPCNRLAWILNKYNKRQKKFRKTHEDSNRLLKWGQSGCKVVHLHENYMMIVKMIMVKNKQIINSTKAERLSWFRHINRMTSERMVKKMCKWNPVV